MTVLQNESDILDYFRDPKLTNPKKIRRLAQRLYFKCKTDLQRKVCTDILEARDPLFMIRDYLSKIDDFVILSKDFIDQGYHGMIFTGDNGDVVYPVTLDTLPHWLDDPNNPWNEDDEKEIIYNVAKSYADTVTNPRVLVKVVLFPDFGFSGIPRIHEIRK